MKVFKVSFSHLPTSVSTSNCFRIWEKLALKDFFQRCYYRLSYRNLLVTSIKSWKSVRLTQTECVCFALLFIGYEPESTHNVVLDLYELYNTHVESCVGFLSENYTEAD